MSTGRTTWRAKPCGWRDRERVVALGEEFGPAGPIVLDVLEELAKEQRDENGRVRTGLRSLARSAFLPRGSSGATEARAILEFAATVGALDELAINEDADMTVRCRVSGFAEDQGRGYESVRKSQQRAGDTPGQSGTDRDNAPACPHCRDKKCSCPVPRDSVPVCPPTGQDRTEENSSVAPNGDDESNDGKLVPADLDAARRRLTVNADVQSVFDAWIAATNRTGRTVLDGKRRRVIQQALKSFPVPDLVDAVNGWRHSPHHRGENSTSTIYNDLAVLLRDAGQIEKFRDLQRQHGGATSGRSATDERLARLNREPA